MQKPQYNDCKFTEVEALGEKKVPYKLKFKFKMPPIGCERYRYSKTDIRVKEIDLRDVTKSLLLVIPSINEIWVPQIT